MRDENTQEFGDEDFSEKSEEESGEEDNELGSKNEVSEGEEFVAENELGVEEDSFPVDNERETMSLSISSKRIKKMSIDRLSALPDSLLIHILSSFNTQDAARTCVLSKRWQFLWTKLARLQLISFPRYNLEQTRMFVSMIHSALAIRGGNNLESLLINFHYDKSSDSYVNVWVEFVVKNKMKEVGLVLDFNGDLYRLPEMMYSNSSFTRLSLEGCTFNPRRPILWPSLTKLHLGAMEIREHAIRKILSGCPVLDSLSLVKCSGFNCFKIDSESVRTLEVDDSDRDNEALLEISAPYIHSLNVTVYLEGRKLRLRNIPSALTAKFDFSGDDWDDSFAELISYTKDLFAGFQHVKKLELGSGSIKVLEMLAMSGWQFPQSGRECLIIEVRRDEESVCGILALLESSPSLGTLVIKGCSSFGERIRRHPPARGDLDCNLLHLKTIAFTDFGIELDGKPMLKLAQILLKSAIVLEKMVIKEYKFSSRQASRVFIKTAQTLLSYPRSSQKAVVLLRDNLWY